MVFDEQIWDQYYENQKGGGKEAEMDGNMGREKIKTKSLVGSHIYT